MEDYETRWRGPSRGRGMRASSEFRESSVGRHERDYRESSVLSSSSRNVRATSVLPASLKHYDDLAEADEDYVAGYGYLNSGLHRARRAISEAKEILRHSSPSVERSTLTSSAYERSSRLEGIKELSSEMSQKKNLYENGTYKITVTPNTDYWSARIPRRLYTRSTIAALLAAYSPRNFPDFIFGRYAGSSLSQPLSSTMDYYNSVNLIDEGLGSGRKERESSTYRSNLESNSSSKMNTSSLDASTRSLYNRSAIYDSKNRAESQSRAASYYDDEAHREASVGRRGRSASRDLYNIFNRDKEYNDELISTPDLLAKNNDYYSNYYGRNNGTAAHQMSEGNVIKDKRKSKFYHYYIPRHYPGTPMLGGYLVPTGRDYGWKY